LSNVWCEPPDSQPQPQPGTAPAQHRPTADAGHDKKKVKADRDEDQSGLGVELPPQRLHVRLEVGLLALRNLAHSQSLAAPAAPPRAAAKLADATGRARGETNCCLALGGIVAVHAARWQAPRRATRSHGLQVRQRAGGGQEVIIMQAILASRVA